MNGSDGIFFIFFYCCLQLSRCQTDFERGIKEPGRKQILTKNEKFISEDVAGSAVINDGIEKMAMELFPPNENFQGRRRNPRILFPKIHSAASFLTGLKLGAILSKKGFALGHGQISSSHNFQIFGKTVNTASSLSYGNINPFLPNDEVQSDEEPPAATGATGTVGDPKRSTLKKDVFHVTVIENPSDRVLEKLQGVIATDLKEKLEEGSKDGSEEVEKNENFQSDEKQESEEEISTDRVDRVKRFEEDTWRRTNSNYSS